MTLSSDLVMVETRLKEFIAAFDAGCVEINSQEIDRGDGTQPHPWHEEWLHHARTALQSVDGGVQVAAKQESCPESAPRTETAIVPARRECRCDNPMVKCDHTGVRCTMCGELARIDAALSGVTNSAPASRASHNSGERDPVVMPDCPGADTKSDGGVEGHAGARPTDHDAGNLRSALKGLIDYVERNECTHEETHRGGAIWTICDCCGRKWADDRGGFVPYIEPVELTNARAAIDQLERKSSTTDDAGNLSGLAEPNHHQPHALSQGWRDDMGNAPRDRPVFLLSIQPQENGGFYITGDAAQWCEASRCFVHGLGFKSGIGNAVATHWRELSELGLPI